MQRYLFTFSLIILASASLYGTPAQNKKGTNMIHITSSSIKDGAEIPAQFTCAGEDISPHLQWKAIDHAKSYVLIVDDPDAQRVVGKTFVHWIIILPAHITELAQGISSKQHSSTLGIELLNDFKTKNYGGPCPPKGSGVHSYQFTLFALDKDSESLQQDAHFPQAPFTAKQFRKKLQKNIIQEGQIIGTFVQ